jgi:hypothetical protein
VEEVEVEKEKEEITLQGGGVLGTCLLQSLLIEGGARRREVVTMTTVLLWRGLKLRTSSGGGREGVEGGEMWRRWGRGRGGREAGSWMMRGQCKVLHKCHWQA